jgi:hypothetical protein
VQKVNDRKTGRRRKRNGPEQFHSQWLMLRNNCMILGWRGGAGVDQNSFGPTPQPNLMEDTITPWVRSSHGDYFHILSLLLCNIHC